MLASVSSLGWQNKVSMVASVSGGAVVVVVVGAGFVALLRVRALVAGFDRGSHVRLKYWFFYMLL